MTMSRSEQAFYMQHQCYHLGVLCNHVDIKASIFLSVVAAMVLAYAFSPAVNLITLVGAVAFTIAVPIRIGVQMLGNTTLNAGPLLTLSNGVPPAPGSPEHESYWIHLVDDLDRAIHYNTRLLRTKHTQHWNIMLISLCIFGFIMTMTVVGTFIEPPAWSTYPFH